MVYYLNFIRSSTSRVPSPIPISSSSPPNLHLISAASMLPSYGAARQLLPPMEPLTKKAGLHWLENGNKICAEIGVTPRTVMEFGNPKEAICEAVGKLCVDFVVVGSHGRGLLQRAFLGSASNYCVNNAKCPVLVVRTKA